MSKLRSRGDGVLEVSSARSKLDGVLQTLVEKQDEGISSESVKEPPRLDTDDDSSPMSTPTKKFTPSSSKIRKRKRGREESMPDVNQFHHSYIMKLFDRSVDLAQFSYDTPLYPVCRAWIRNLSQLPASTEQPASNEPPDESQRDSSDVYSLPVPPGIKLEAGCTNMWIPSPLPTSDSHLDIHVDQDQAPAPENLLLSHMQRWKRIRQQWKQASRIKEACDATNLKLLKDIYEKHCRDQF